MPPPPHTLAGPGQGSVRRVPRLCVRMCIRLCLAVVLGAQRTSGEAKWNPMASPITQAPSSIRYLLDSYGILASGQMNGMGWRHLDDAEEAPGAHVSLPNSWAVTGSQVCNASDRAPWLESRFGNNATLWAPDIPPHTTYEREGMPVYFSVHDPYNGSCVMRALGHLVHAPNNYTVVEPWTARWEMDKEPVLCTPIGVAEGPNAAEPSVLVDPETDTLWMAIGSHHGELNKIVERERSRLDGLGIDECVRARARPFQPPTPPSPRLTSSPFPPSLSPRQARVGERYVRRRGRSLGSKRDRRGDGSARRALLDKRRGRFRARGRGRRPPVVGLV